MLRLNNSAEVCGHDKFQCLEYVEKQRYLRNENYTCDCLAECIEIDYDIKVSNVPIEQRSYAEEEENANNTDKAILRVFYNQDHFRSHNKSEVFGYTELFCEFKNNIWFKQLNHLNDIQINFLASVGAILGLFIGFSVFSAIELLYFMTCRPYYAFKQNMKRHDDEGVKFNDSNIEKGPNTNIVTTMNENIGAY